MEDPMPENEYRRAREIFRTVGPLLLSIAVILLIIGFVDFFSAANAMHAPRHFGLLFVGLPLLVFGVGMTKAGYAGKIARYFGREYAPAVSKTFNEIASDSREGIGAIAEVIRKAPVGDDTGRLCPECGHSNDYDAKFCAACGRSLPVSITCPDCGEPAAPGARFCDECGRPLESRQ